MSAINSHYACQAEVDGGCQKSWCYSYADEVDEEGVVVEGIDMNEDASHISNDFECLVDQSAIFFGCVEKANVHTKPKSMAPMKPHT